LNFLNGSGFGERTKEILRAGLDSMAKIRLSATKDAKSLGLEEEDMQKLRESLRKHDGLEERPAEESKELGNADAAAEADKGAPDDEARQSEAAGTEEPRRPIKTFEQMMSLKPDDDEQTRVSKKVSWILRHGARKAKVEIDADGWVRLDVLLATDILDGVPLEKLLGVVQESNVQKTRYELKDMEDGGQAIRAVGKHTMGGLAGGQPRERRRRPDAEEAGREAPNGDGLEAVAASVVAALDDDARDAPRGEDGDGLRVSGTRYPPRAPRDSDAAATAAGKGSWDRPGGPPDRERYWDGYDRSWDRGLRRGRYGGNQEMTFEQQVEAGFKPLHHGNEVVAMVFDGVSVKPGRRQESLDREARERMERREEKGEKGHGKYGREDKGGKSKGKDRSRYEPRDEPLPLWAQDDVSTLRLGKGGRGPRWPRWKVCAGQEALVRQLEVMESEAVTSLPSGSVVEQTGEEMLLANGIVRMPVFSVSPAGISGWVTKTAEAAGGPVYFVEAPQEWESNKGWDPIRAERPMGGKGKDGGKMRDGRKGSRDPLLGGKEGGSGKGRDFRDHDHDYREMRDGKAKGKGGFKGKRRSGEEDDRHM